MSVSEMILGVAIRVLAQKQIVSTNIRFPLHVSTMLGLKQRKRRNKFSNFWKTGEVISTINEGLMVYGSEMLDFGIPRIHIEVGKE